MPKLTDPDLKSNRMLNLGNGCNFQWYFTGPRAFGGILRKSRSFSAMRSIFPYLNSIARTIFGFLRIAVTAFGFLQLLSGVFVVVKLFALELMAYNSDFAIVQRKSIGGINRKS